MNKKFYLGAILLGAMTLSTGALTSCIDNDEPEGITELRGAKAELLRAKAAVELAKAETEKQQANYVAALAAVQQALAAQEQAKVKYFEAEAAIKAAESEEAKAAAELAKEQAKLEAEKAKAEAEAYITLQKQLQAQYQFTLEQTLRDIETAKAVLTDAQQAKLTALEEELKNKQVDYNIALNWVLECQEWLFIVVNSDNKDIARYEKEVEKAKANLAKVNASYESLKALAENAEITAWEKEYNEFKEYVGYDPSAEITFNGTKYKVGNGKASVEAAEIALAGEKALAGATEEKAQYEADITAYIQAQQYYNYLAAPAKAEIKKDCFDNCGEDTKDKYGYWNDPTTHEPSNFVTKDEKGNDVKPKKYEIPGHKFEVENSRLDDAVGSPEFFKKEFTYRVLATAFAEDINDDKLLGGTDGLRSFKEKVANFKVTAEQIEEDNCIATQKEWTVDYTQKEFDKAVDLFEKMHKQYQTGEIVSVVSTAKVDAAVAAYNEAYNALKAAVEAANKTYDDQAAAVKNVLKTQTDAEYEKKIAAAKFEAQKNVAKTWLADTENSGVVINIDDCATLEEIENTIKAKNSAIKAATATGSKLDAATVIAKLKKDTKFVNAYEDSFATKADRDAAEKKLKEEAAEAAEKSKAYKDALAAQDKANAAAKKAWQDAEKAIDVVNNKDDKYGKIQEAFDAYSDEAKVYAQKLKADANYEALRGFENAKGDANKYAKVGDEKDKPSGVIASYVVDAVKLDKDGKKYEAVEGHVALTVPAMDTKAVATALTLVVISKDEITNVWHEFSEAAFGYVRHTALTEELLQESNVVGLDITNPANSTVTIVDENGTTETIFSANTKSAFGKLLIAKEIVASHEELAKAGEAAAELLKEIEAYEQEIKDVIAPITAAVQKAEEDVEAAKAAHIASYNAYTSIAKEYVAQLNEIVAKVAGESTVKTSLDQMINAYYNNTKFVYIDPDGNEHSIGFNNGNSLLTWVEYQLKEYEDEFEGLIVSAENDLAEAEQTLWEATNDDAFDAVARAKQDVEAAQAEADLAKSYYDYALAQLQKYLEALAK